MACTTLLVGKHASFDGSTIVARNEDCCSGEMNEKKFEVMLPEHQPRYYKSVVSHVEIELPNNPMRYTHTPDAINTIGIWGEAGVNEAQVAMSATETITSNERVLGADPLVDLIPARGKPGDENYIPELPGGIGEEDFVTIVLPYIKTPREGVLRLGALLEEFGTYEMNGVAFSNTEEIWWLETIGGHHWMARRVPDDCYVTMPNQLGIDSFDFEDAFGAQENHLCSADLLTFVKKNHLDVTGANQAFNPRDVFGSHSDADRVYNTPRAWAMQRFLNPHALNWDAEDAELSPESFNIPWACVPERKITIEDVKYIMGMHYQGTKYDPYGNKPEAGKYRCIGINRNCELSILQMRGYMPKELCAIQWLSLGCNVYNCMVPLYTNINAAPEYVSNTGAKVNTESMYWTNRLIAALSDAHYALTLHHIETYQDAMGAYGNKRVHEIDAECLKNEYTGKELCEYLEKANEQTCEYIKEETIDVLGKVLFDASNNMKNAYSRDDA